MFANLFQTLQQEAANPCSAEQILGSTELDPNCIHLAVTMVPNGMQIKGAWFGRQSGNEALIKLYLFAPLHRLVARC